MDIRRQVSTGDISETLAADGSFTTAQFPHVDLKSHFAEFRDLEVPHYIIPADSNPWCQSERDLKEECMRTLLKNPEKIVAASAHYGWVHVFIVVPEVTSPELEIGRAGIIFTQTEAEPPVPGGYWMDFWEEDHGITKDEYKALPRNERAELEAKLQLQYVLTQYWPRHLEFWEPAVLERCIREKAGFRAGLFDNPELAQRLVEHERRQRAASAR